MRHYARENEKSQARIALLEQRKSTCEAGLVAIAACWEQVRCLVIGFMQSNSSDRHLSLLILVGRYNTDAHGAGRHAHRRRRDQRWVLFPGIDRVSSTSLVLVVHVDLFDLSQHVSADSSLKTALEQNMHATQRLVTSFLKSRPALSHDATYQHCQKVQTEVRPILFSLRLMSTQGCSVRHCVPR